MASVDGGNQDSRELEHQAAQQRDPSAHVQLPEQQVHPHTRQGELEQEHDDHEPAGRKDQGTEEPDRIERTARIGKYGKTSEHVGDPLGELSASELVGNGIVERERAGQIVGPEKALAREHGREEEHEGEAEVEQRRSPERDPAWVRESRSRNGVQRRRSPGFLCHRSAITF
jgi:hypothetical protein